MIYVVNERYPELCLILNVNDLSLTKKNKTRLLLVRLDSFENSENLELT